MDFVEFGFSLSFGISLLNRLQVKDLIQLKEMTVTVGLHTVLELMGASMSSKTTLIDVFSPKSASTSQEEKEQKDDISFSGS